MSKQISWICTFVALLFTTAGCTQAQHQGGAGKLPLPQPNNTSQFSSQSGVDINGRKVVTAIANESLAKKNLTDEQITTLSSYANSRDMLVRLQVMSALRYAGSSHAQAACTIARKGLVSTDSMTRLYALTSLDKLNPTDIVSIARRMASDRSQYVRPEAQKILKKRGADS